MKIHSALNLVLFVLMLLSLMSAGGCAKFDIGEQNSTLGHDLVPIEISVGIKSCEELNLLSESDDDSKTKDAKIKDAVNQNYRFLATANEFGLIKKLKCKEKNKEVIKDYPAIPPYPNGKNSATQLIPDWIKESEIGMKMSFVGVSDMVISDLKIDKPTSMEFSAKELSDFYDKSIRKLSLKSKEEKEYSIYEKRLYYYLISYLKGSYIDRSGTKFNSPKISSSVGNDTIIPSTMVAIDAYIDTVSDYLVFYKMDEKKKLNPIVDNEPTCVKFERDVLGIEDTIEIEGIKKPNPQSRVREVVDFCETRETLATKTKCDQNQLNNWKNATYQDITTREAQTIASLTGISAEQSKHIAALIVRLFNDVEFGAIVIGGDLSIGDNDTFSKEVEAIVSSLSRNYTEKKLQQFLKENGEKEKLQQIMEIVSFVYDTTQAQK